MNAKRKTKTPALGVILNGFGNIFTKIQIMIGTPKS
jgi:hypothetical protein